MLSNLYFGNHCYIKGKLSQHLEMRLYSLDVFTNMPLVQSSLSLCTFFWLQQNHLLCILICSRENQGKNISPLWIIKKGPELTSSPVMWLKAGHHSNLFLVWRIRKRLCVLHTVRTVPEKCLSKGSVKQGLTNFLCKGPLGLCSNYPVLL